MCTVSVIQLPGGGYRVVVNRDESRQRAEAIPPQWRDLGGLSAIYPVDPVGGGTWAAATSRGLSMCLLNHTLDQAPPLPAPHRLVSRGRIILDALRARTAVGVAEFIERLDLGAFAPFRLLAVDPPSRTAAGDTPISTPISAVQVTWDRRALRVGPVVGGPICLVSSGLGDHLVAPRLSLFREVVDPAAPTPESQDLFHRHTWPSRPELSVMMTRPEARTVSILTLEVRPTANGEFGVGGKSGGSGGERGANIAVRYEAVPEPVIAAATGGALAG